MSAGVDKSESSLSMLLANFRQSRGRPSLKTVTVSESTISTLRKVEKDLEAFRLRKRSQGDFSYNESPLLQKRDSLPVSPQFSEQFNAKRLPMIGSCPEIAPNDSVRCQNCQSVMRVFKKSNSQPMPEPCPESPIFRKMSIGSSISTDARSSPSPEPAPAQRFIFF